MVVPADESGDASAEEGFTFFRYSLGSDRIYS
jgi:hypothetical protein